MNSIRVIPRLDIKGPNLVKGIHLEGLRVLGKPKDFAKYYYDNGADELIYMDVVASLYDRNSLSEFVKDTAKEIFIPLTVGGGIRTLDDIKIILRSGADKVSINTAAIRNPEFIKNAVLKFGSSTIVVAIEAIKQKDGNFMAYVDNGREYTGMDVVEWAKKVEEYGAGELMLTSVDREGTGKGFDLDLIKAVSKVISIPLIIHGGPGKIQHFCEVLKLKNINGLAISSMLHYNFISNNKININNEQEGNKEYLLCGKETNLFDKCTIASIKNAIIESSLLCRN